MKKSFLFFTILFFTILFFQCFYSNAQWVGKNVGATGYLTSVYFLNDNLGYVSEDNGNVYKTTNGGNTWSNVFVATNTNGIQKIQFTSADTGFAVSGTELIKTTNGGVTWVNKFINPNPNLFVIDISFPTKNVGYMFAADFSVSTDTSFLFKSTDAGETWTQIYQTGAMGNIQFLDANTGYASINFNTCKTTNGGITWNTMNTAAGLFHFLNNSVGYVFPSNTSVNKTINNGSNWTTYNFINAQPLYGAYFVNLDTGYIVGGNGISAGVILKTSNGGVNWSIDKITSETLTSVYFPSKNVGFACGEVGMVYKYIAPNSVNNFEKEKFVKVYPNPCVKQTNVEITLPNESDAYIAIYNLLGAEIKKYSVKNNETISVNTSEYENGIYLFVLMNHAGVISKQRVVVNK